MTIGGSVSSLRGFAPAVSKNRGMRLARETFGIALNWKPKGHQRFKRAQRSLKLRAYTSRPRTSRWRVSRSCRSCRPRRARDPSPRRGAPAVGLARGIGRPGACFFLVVFSFLLLFSPKKNLFFLGFDSGAVFSLDVFGPKQLDQAYVFPISMLENMASTGLGWLPV